MNDVRAIVANHIQSDISELMKLWRGAVREDNRIRSDEGLSREELTDHVPQIIEEICELLRSGKEPTAATIDEARANLYVRVHQRYTGRISYGNYRY